MAEPKDIQQIAFLEHIKSMIASRFSPAFSEADADLTITTADFCERIAEFNGIEMDKESVVLMLQEMNFKSIPNAQMHFVWLLKEN